MTTIASLFTEWGFKVDDAQLRRADDLMVRARANADRLGSAASGVADNFRTAASGSGGFRGALENLESKVTSSIGSIARLGFGVAALFSGQALGVGSVLHLAGEFEQIQVAFETMIGDTDRAKKALADLQNFAMRTPFNFKELAEGSKQLLAFGYQAEQLVPTMETLGNIAAGVGKDKLPRLIMALGQAKAAGHLQGHILREFTMAGVPLGGEIAKGRGVAPGAIEGQRIPFAEVEKALYNLSHGTGRFTGLLEKQSHTLLGMVSNVVDYLQLLAKRLGDRGLMAQAKKYIEQFQSFLVTNDAAILGLLDRIVHAMVRGMNGAIKLASAVNGIVQALGGWDTVITAISYGMSILLGMKILTFVGDLTIGLYSAAKAFALFGAEGALAAAVPLAIGAAIVGLLLLIEDVVSYFQGKKSFTGYLLGNMDEAGGGVSKWIQGIFGNFEGTIDKAIKPILGKLKDVGKLVGIAIIDGIDELTTVENWQKLGDVILAALKVVLSAGNAMLDIGVAIADGIINGLIVGLKERFPTIAQHLGLDDVADNASPGRTIVDKARGALTAAKDFAGSKIDAAVDFAASASGPLYGVQAPAPVARGGTTVVTHSVNAPVTLHLGSNLTPEQGENGVRAGIKDHLDNEAQKIRRAAAGAPVQ